MFLLNTLLWFPFSVIIKFKLLTKNKQFSMFPFLNIFPTLLFIPFFLLIILWTHCPFFSLPVRCQVLSYSQNFSLAFLEHCLSGSFSSPGCHGARPSLTTPVNSVFTVECTSTLLNSYTAQVHLFTRCYFFSSLVDRQ